MSHTLQPWVETNSLKAFCVGQEEVDHPTGHHTVGEAVHRPEGPWPPVKTVPVLPLLQQQLELEHVSKDTAADLARGRRNPR